MAFQTKELIEKAVSGAAPIYHGGGVVEESSTTESGWHKVYKDLMNGVSHMLPSSSAAES